MYAKNDKRRLFWLMKCYLDGLISESTFCDEFYYSYDLEIRRSSNTLCQKEFSLFEELDAISSRYSPYQSDHKLDPQAFTTKQQLKDKIYEVFIKLTHQENPLQISPQNQKNSPNI